MEAVIRLHLNSDVGGSSNTLTPPTNTAHSNNSSSGNGNTSTNQVASASAIGKKATVTATTLNVRSGARVDRPLITKLSAGTQVTILDVLGDWYKIRLADNKVGFASAAYLTVSAESANNITGQMTNNTGAVDSVLGSGINFPCTGTVTASSLNVRSGARVDRPLITKLPAGTKVTVLAMLNDWLKIKMANGQIGWVSSEFVSL